MARYGTRIQDKKLKNPLSVLCDRNYPAKALQPTFDIIEQASIVYLE